MRIISKRFAVVFLHAIMVLPSSGSKLAALKRLGETVFAPYVGVIPLCTDGPVVVNILLAVQYVIELVEDKEQLILNGWYSFDWVDCKLMWNASDYGDVTRGIFPDTSRLWLPDVTWLERVTMVQAYEYQDNIFVGAVAKVANSGLVSVTRQIVLSAFCPLETHLFPFDEQRCNFTFTSWNYDASKLLLTSKTSHLDMSVYEQSGMWSIVKAPTFNSNQTTSAGKFSQVTYVVILQRKALFFIFYLMLPGFATSLLGSFVYLLPPGAQERNTFSLSIIISLTISMNSLVQHTPTEGDVPLLYLYFFTMFLVTTASAACNILIQGICATHPSKKVPRCLWKLFSCTLAKFACFRFQMSVYKIDDRSAVGATADRLEEEPSHQTTELSQMARQSVDEGLHMDISQTSEISCSTSNNISDPPESLSGLADARVSANYTSLALDWWHLAYAADRLFFFTHSALLVLTFVVFMSAGMAHYTNE